MDKLVDFIKQYRWVFALPLLVPLSYYMSFVDKVLKINADRLAIHRNDPSFRSIAIQSKIDSIEYYDKGWPQVILEDGRSVSMELAKSGSEYLQAGDSIVKLAKTDSVTVYRHLPAYTEVRVYGAGEHHGIHDLDYEYSGLLKRYRIPNQPH